MPEALEHLDRRVGPWQWQPGPVGSGWTLAAPAPGEELLLLAPGVAVGDEEPGALGHWRLAVLDSDEELLLLTASVALDTAEVLALVEDEHRDDIRELMRAQVRDAVRFMAPGPGEPMVESRAQAASRRLTALAAELEAAFPGEAWHQVGAPSGCPAPAPGQALISAVAEVIDPPLDERKVNRLARAEDRLDTCEAARWAMSPFSPDPLPSQRGHGEVWSCSSTDRLPQAEEDRRVQAAFHARPLSCAADADHPTVAAREGLLLVVVRLVRNARSQEGGLPGGCSLRASTPLQQSGASGQAAGAARGLLLEVVARHRRAQLLIHWSRGVLKHLPVDPEIRQQFKELVDQPEANTPQQSKDSLVPH